MKNWFFLCLGLLYFSLSYAQNTPLASKHIDPLVTEDAAAQKQWVDSLYNSMSLEEKVGQLFMTMVFSNKPKEVAYAKTLIKDYHLGGVIFSKGGPIQQAKATNEFQSLSKYPMWIGQDAEWGLAMRLDSTYAFPWNMTLGAIENNRLVKMTGAQIAKHCKRIGVQFDFTPDVDINTNPKNPIIGNRSFGEDRANVTQKGIAYIRGMEGEGVLTSIKHFPGHGDTDQDTHKTLPVLNFTRERLDSVEFYPYEKIIPLGITSSVMITHLDVPVLDNRPDYPSSLSKPIITGVLKNELGFKGLVVTDALNMNGVANYEKPGKTSLDALLAGNDLLLVPRDMIKGAEAIIKAYKDGKVTEKRLAHSVKRILMAKYKAGLSRLSPVNTIHLVEDLNSKENDLLYAKLMEDAITVVKNNNAVLPVKDLDKKKIAYVHLGDVDGDDFYNRLKKYTKVDKIEANSVGDLIEKLSDYNYVIVGFHKSNANPWKSYKFTEKEKVWLHEISLKHRTILSVMANPYALLGLRTTTNLDGIVIGYQNSKIGQEKTAEVIFGAIGAKGKLPVSCGKNFPVGTQFKTEAVNRLSYGIPESVGVSSEKLKKIDSIANDAIAKKMTPGMQVLVARKGKVIFEKNYGYQTYKKKRPITDESLYDLASMTKILATLPLIMEQEEQGIINLDMKLGKMMPFLKDSNKADITLKEALSHYGRFWPWIPYYKLTLEYNGNPSPEYYRIKKDSVFNIPVAHNLYMRSDYRDSIFETIKDSKLRRYKEYKYSDLPFYLMSKYLSDYYHITEDKLVESHFYQSLGANYMGYLPLQKFNKWQIVPAEVDNYFRHQPLRGYVDDEGAAMLGGVSGHAGLYSNANDVAKILQMYLNGGNYGGKQYFKKSTVDKFNTCYFCSKDVRRGVGFDKPQLSGPGPASKSASKDSFGHTGFTGSIGWVDPDEDLVYVCLSNRTYPDRDNQDFIREDVRSKIQEAIYRAIIIPNNIVAQHKK